MVICWTNNVITVYLFKHPVWMMLISSSCYATLIYLIAYGEVQYQSL